MERKNKMDEKIVAEIAYDKHVDAFLDYTEYNFLGYAFKCTINYENYISFCEKEKFDIVASKDEFEKFMTEFENAFERNLWAVFGNKEEG
jgi:hypothetical protein